MGLLFEWDPGKAHRNLRKHGVGFEEATTVFGDRWSLEIADPRHSEREQRFALVGTSDQGRVLVVVHTERGDRVRIISARKATRRERKQYEEG